jgi:alkanesulfonate monooxygenase SsuD/methylene tetrahydromethanopterin reductase-like flavin-dependent oxidoreductase (luciferase family)
VEEEFTSTGVPFETRGGRLNEFIPLLRHLWTSPETPWNGKHFNIPAVGLVKPATPGGPPIYLGAGGPAGLRRAAKFGDGFISVALQPVALAGLKQKLEELRTQFGRGGAFPFLAQAAPPATIDDARIMLKNYGEAGVDGLILTYEDDLPDAFLRRRDTVRALIEG